MRGDVIIQDTRRTCTIKSIRKIYIYLKLGAEANSKAKQARLVEKYDRRKKTDVI